MSYALDDAAAAALWSLRQSSSERMGALYRDAGGFGRTPTIEGGDDGVKGQLRIPTGSLAALFHNHPPAEGRDDSFGHRFSDDDKAQARRLGVPSYITTADGTVRRFDPKRNRTEEVLAEFPIAEWRAQVMQTILGRSPDDPRGLMR